MDERFARDIIALGSWPFYGIVFIRAVIGDFAPFIAQLSLALIALIILSCFIEGNQYIARGLILMVFVSLFYNEFVFSFFAGVLWIGMLWSLVTLKTSRKEIVNGIVLGAIALAVGYFGTISLL